MPFYAVAVGHRPGIYDTWEACQVQVHKFKSAKHKKFKTRAEAERFIIENKPGVRPDNKSISRSVTTRKLSAFFTSGSGSLGAAFNVPSPASVFSVPSPGSVFSAPSPAASLDSVIFDKITPKSSSSRLTRVVSEETIVLSDDDLPNSPTIIQRGPSRLSETEHSVILLDDDDSLPAPTSETRKSGKQQKSDNAIIRTSPRRAITRSATKNRRTTNNAHNPLPDDSHPGHPINNGTSPAVSTPVTSKAPTRTPATSIPAFGAPSTSTPAFGTPSTSTPSTSAPSTSAPSTSTPSTSTHPAANLPAFIPLVSSPARTPVRSSGRSQIKLNLKTKPNDENQSRNEKSKTNQAPPSRKGHVVVYTDGACSNNGYANAKAGIGVWWGENDPRNISEPLAGRATNNRAEIWAAVKAINQAADEGYDSITICSDRYAIQRKFRTFEFLVLH